MALSGNALPPQLQSRFFPPQYLMALGRLVELSATLETQLLDVLCEAIDLSGNAGEALFLGENASKMAERIKSLKEFEDLPRWVRDYAVPWAVRAKKAIDDRSAIVHRPPIYFSDPADEDAEPRLGLRRVRKGHRDRFLDDAALQQEIFELIDRMNALCAEAFGDPFDDPWGRY